MSMLDKFSSQYSGMPIDVLEKQLTDKRKFIEKQLLEQEVIKADLALYLFSGYGEWKNKLLGKERHRLTEVSMTMAADAVELRRELIGQFNEIELLLHTKENLEIELDICQKKVSNASKQIEQIEKQLIKKEKH